MPWQEGDTFVCPHCNRECIIQRNVPMDITTHKRHSCEAYKKYVKANPKPKGSLSETFSAHSSDKGGKMVEVPYRGSGRWVRKKWRDEMETIKRADGTEYRTAWGYMTDEAYEAKKNMSLFLARYQKPMIDYFIPNDESSFDYNLDITESEKKRMHENRRTSDA